MTLSRVIDGEPSPNGLRRIGVVHGVQHDPSVAPMHTLVSQPEGLSHRGGTVASRIPKWHSEKTEKERS